VNSDTLITLPKEKRDDMITAMKNYFQNGRGEEIGNLTAGLMPDFIVKELACPDFITRVSFDSPRYMEEMIGDLLSIQK
jgi:uncharacterized protein (DUF2164 family)